MREFRLLVLAIVPLSGVLFTSGSASAHDLQAIVTVADEVKVVAYFDDDMPAEEAQVTVLDANGNEVNSGKTDERGTWVFARPTAGEYTLTVKCIGHVAKVSFLVEASPKTDPTVFSDWRLNKTIGLAIGLALLLGLSAISWFIRHRRRG